MNEAHRENFLAAARVQIQSNPNKCHSKRRDGQPCRKLAAYGTKRCTLHLGANKKKPEIIAIMEKRAKSRGPEAYAKFLRRRAGVKLKAQWMKDPRVPGKLIHLRPTEDHAALIWCRRELGVDLMALDLKYPGLGDAARWVWLRAEIRREPPSTVARAVEGFTKRLAATVEVFGEVRDV